MTDIAEISEEKVSQKRFYTVKEVAKLLTVSKSLIYNQAQSNDIPNIRLGKRILIPLSYVKNLMSIS